MLNDIEQKRRFPHRRTGRNNEHIPRLHPDEQYSIVDAVAFLDWLNQCCPSLEKLRDALNKKRQQNRQHV
ncbi:MAG: hypothetical protein LUE13_07035 [Akkermansiaceae bacterium]|nr:hypothetical protein [Akkermansiaceae bacterium]